MSQRTIQAGDVAQITVQGQAYNFPITKIDSQGFQAGSYLIVPQETSWQVQGYTLPHTVTFLPTPTEEKAPSLKLFRPKSIATVTVGNQSYDYYLVDDDRLALIEEKPTLRLVQGQVENLSSPHSVLIKPLYRVESHIPLRVLNKPLRFTVGNHQVSIDQIYSRGGEAVIYKGTLNGQPVIIKTYIKVPRTLRGLSPELRPYLPKKYLLFEDLSRGHFITMEPLEELVYSQKVFNQSLEFLNLLEALNEVHGDISPGNLLQDSEGNLKIIDFARPGLLGTPFYSQGHSDRQAMARVLLGYKYAPLIRNYINEGSPTLYKLYRYYQSRFSGADENQFFKWFQETFPQDQESLQLLMMAGLTPQVATTDARIPPTETSEPPVYAIYSRTGPRKILMLLKPRSREVVYTPLGIQLMNLNPQRLPSYEIATNIFSKGDYVALPYLKGRSEAEVEQLISRQPVPPEYQIRDIVSEPIYRGPYGKIEPVGRSLQQVVPCQEHQHFNLANFPKGSPFYSQFIPLLSDFQAIPGQMILGKEGESIISSTLGFEEILEDLQKCGRVYYLIGVSKDKIHLTSVASEVIAHAMAVVIDPQSGILELFDPNGISPDTRHVYYWTNRLIDFLRENGITLQRRITADEPFCPQGVSAFAPEFRGEQQCLVWAFWYVWLRVNNPGVPGEAIRRYMMRLSPEEAFDRIRRIASIAFGAV